MYSIEVWCYIKLLYHYTLLYQIRTLGSKLDVFSMQTLNQPSTLKLLLLS